MEPNQNLGQNIPPALENKAGIGSIVGTVIIIALIILGGLYFWGKHVKETQSTADLTSEANDGVTDSEAAAIKSMSSSDELSSIDADLQSTNTANLSPELE